MACFPVLGCYTLLGLVGWRLLPFVPCRPLSLARDGHARALWCPSLAMWLFLGSCVSGPIGQWLVGPFFVFFFVISLSRFMLVRGAVSITFLSLLIPVAFCLRSSSRIALHTLHAVGASCTCLLCGLPPSSSVLPVVCVSFASLASVTLTLVSLADRGSNLVPLLLILDLFSLLTILFISSSYLWLLTFSSFVLSCHGLFMASCVARSSQLFAGGLTLVLVRLRYMHEDLSCAESS